MSKIKIFICIACTIISTNSKSQTLTIRSWQDIKFNGITIQSLDYSCGAAALSILIQGYFGDDWQERELLPDIVSRLNNNQIEERVRDGFSMLDIKSEAIRLGYTADGIHINTSDINKLAGPVIILIKRDKIHHFVVLKGTANGIAFIADPRRGHIRIPLADLNTIWDGDILVLGKDGFGLPKNYPLAVQNNTDTNMSEYSARFWNYH